MRLHGVGRRYRVGGPWVLRDVDLELRPGTLVRIDGANGGGKSTLLRLIAGIDAPGAGRITGRPRTAYVPERFPGALPFTALGYLTHLGRIQGLRRGPAATAAGHWLERFGAAGTADVPLAELSKGGCQKVAVAQALLADPDLLVLDEAWTGLDHRAGAELDRVVAERVADGCTVVFVDHDPRRLAGAPDAAYRVEDGGLVPAAGPAAGGAGAACAAAGPRTVVEVVGPPGAALPDDLPGRPDRGPAPEGGLRLTVASACSDALLRALLTARPPWHVRSVGGPPADGGAGEPTGGGPGGSRTGSEGR